jgi:hypothetical protein
MVLDLLTHLIFFSSSPTEKVRVEEKRGKD